MTPRTLLRAAALAAAALLASLPGAGAAPGAVKDPAFAERLAAFTKVVRPLPDPPRKPNPPGTENRLSGQQWSERASAQEAETTGAVAAVHALAATRDSRVFEELVKGLGLCSRLVPLAETNLLDATEKFDQVRIPYFQSREDYFRRTGAWPDTILVSVEKSLDATDWVAREAAHGYDFAVRLRDACVEGMGENLALLGEDRGQVWKGVARLGLEGKDVSDRLAFCEAVKSVPGPEAEASLLALEAKEKDPVVVAVALEALSLRGSAEGFKRMVKRLGDPETTVVSAAVRGIGRYRSKDTIPALVERLRKAEGRIFSDLTETLFGITGKHLADEATSWDGWWKKDGEAFLRRWADDPKARLDEIELIGDTDERLIDVPAELAALLPTETDPKVRDGILENLSVHRSDFARITLIRCLTDPSKSTRLAAIRGLSQYRHVSVPEELMRIVPRADAEETQALFQSLRTLWGGPSEFTVDSPDREKLLRWWDSAKARVPEQFLKLGANNIASGRQQANADEARWRDRNFYGLRVDSDRLLFVVDVSLSMEEPAKKEKPGTATPKDGDPKEDPPPAGGSKDPPKNRKIDVAKRELLRALRGLPDGTQFSLIFFSIKPEVWDQGGMVVMGPETRKKALAWVDALVCHEATNIYDALETAFSIGMPKCPIKATGPADTIFFVSDGAPTAGKFTKPDLIRDYVRRWNKGRNVKIHVIGVGEDHDVVFCRNLAEENGGFYVAK